MAMKAIWCKFHAPKLPGQWTFADASAKSLYLERGKPLAFATYHSPLKTVGQHELNKL